MLLEKILNFFGIKKIMKIISSRWTIKNSYKRSPSNTVAKPASKKIDYLIVDPSLPDLRKQIDPPSYTNIPAINVRNYRGAGFTRSSIEGQAANCFTSIVNTINYVNSISSMLVPKWPGTSCLQVFPRAGVDLNAYYDRSSLKFFYYNDARIGGSFFTCDSSDIVTHELGHAILDAYRPQTWSAMSLEVASMHEAFADLIAILHSLIYDEVLQLVIQETGADLRKENVVSRLAEQFGQILYKISGPNSGRLPNALRSAINDFKYVNPSSLPLEAPNDGLAQECHSFGRIFLGAFYDLLVVFFEDNKAKGLPPVVALKQSRDVLAKYTLKAIQVAPINSKYYQSVAKSMLWADVTIGNSQYQEKMQEVFKNRNLVSTQIRALSAPKCNNEDCVVKNSQILQLKLSDRVISAQSDNFLYSVEVEIPNETAYFYDLNKNIYDSVVASEDESIAGAVDMVTYIYNTNNVSDDSKTLFEIRDGKLVRSHFS